MLTKFFEKIEVYKKYQYKIIITINYVREYMGCELNGEREKGVREVYYHINIKCPSIAKVKVFRACSYSDLKTSVEKVRKEMEDIIDDQPHEILKQVDDELFILGFDTKYLE